MKASARTTTQTPLVNDLFKLMQLRKPHLLVAAYPKPEQVDAAKAEYMRQWEGLTPAMIRKGIERLRNQYPLRYLPDPVEFAREYCHPRPEEFGLPTVDDAWQEASRHCGDLVSHRWSHEAVRLAGKETGWFDLCSAAGAERLRALRQRFEKHYRALCNQVMAGQELSAGLLEHKKTTPAERNEQFYREQQREQMQAQGIDPDGGRAVFLQCMRRL